MRLLTFLLLAACNDQRPVPVDPMDGSSCSVDGPGDLFTFRIVNSGTHSYALNFGCGQGMPFTLQTAGGPTALGPGGTGLNYCQFSCEDLYQGANPFPCSDCGGGSGKALNPGSEVDVQWDRRLYSEITADSTCTSAGSCWLGKLAGADVLPATLLLCDDGQAATGRCLNPFQQVPFSFDPAQSGVTISVQ